MYVELLNKPDPNYTPTESWHEKQQRAKREKAARNAQKLAERTQAWDPLSDKQIRGNAYRTLFVARLSYDVVESDLEKEFSRYGPIERIRVVREKDSDKSRGYAFIEFERERDLKVIKGRKILVDVERGRTVKSWKPAKLGGGLGGRHYTKPKPLLRSQRSDGYSGSSERGGSFRGSSSGGRGGFRGGASRRGGSDRYSSSNSGGVSRQFDGGDRRSSDYGSSGPRKDNYRDRREFKSGPDDRRDKGRRDYRDRSPGRRY
ncbi:hypothetical protein DV452_003834 [Geotrichum candidum]|nr:hypothetical protein DV452_003834 [Geotrichum candidum]